MDYRQKLMEEIIPINDHLSVLGDLIEKKSSQILLDFMYENEFSMIENSENSETLFRHDMQIINNMRNTLIDIRDSLDIFCEEFLKMEGAE